jgi:hypothetical protein
VPDEPRTNIPGRAGKYLNDLDLAMLWAGLPETSRPKLTERLGTSAVQQSRLQLGRRRLLMTSIDAASFGAAMIEPTDGLLTPEEHDLMFTPTTAASEAMPPLGVGRRIDADRAGRRRWYHSGAIPGGCFLLAVYPDQRLSVAIGEGDVSGARHARRRGGPRQCGRELILEP